MLVAGKFDFVPRGNQVLFRGFSPQEYSKGGIMLPDQSRQAPHMGTVLALGPGKEIPWNCRKEDRIFQDNSDTGNPKYTTEFAQRFEPIADLKVGDVIFINVRKAIPVSPEEGDRRCLIDADDILSVVKVLDGERN